MVVQHNLSAMNANRYLGINNSKLSKSLEKLSSGYAINRAGDNAAGLAVSEKMRSQIAGMTQAVKNAQDGISMVQTFEGALTETDSILQRMKTLADQMANGTYDDPVDRTAAQQEFLQLNDELDQIADTDFNGVVVLNGGVMSDGTKANADGLIEYTGSVAGAGAVDEAEEVVPKELGDRILNANAGVGVSNKNALKKLSNAELDNGFKLVKADTTNTGKTEKDAVLQKDHYEKTVGYVYNADKNEWYSSDGTTHKANENGGFTGLYGDTVNVHDTKNPNLATKVKDGDYVLVTYYKGQDATAGELPVTADTTGLVTDTTKASVDNTTASFKLNLSGKKADGDDLTTDEFNKVLAAMEGLDKTTVVISTANTDVGGTGWTSATAPTAGGAGNVVDGTAAAGATLGKGAVTAVYNKNTGTVDFYLNLDTKNDVTIATDATPDQVDNENIVHLGTLKTGKITASDTDKVTYTLNVGKGQQRTDDGDAYIELTPDATATAGKIKNSLKKQLNATTDADDGADSDYKVSQSNAFQKSEAKMTYKDSITLQAGARTKDAVNFTFKYNSDAIGDLKADLNCTAKGLGTDKLNLSTQENANYAIDKIDQAINKVSLVRGTFGAIQNRLEHKIDNLNVSVENLTSAESQIRDTNMPQEMMNFTKQQILAQASQSMLAQANQLPQGVLSLLQ